MDTINVKYLIHEVEDMNNLMNVPQYNDLPEFDFIPEQIQLLTKYRSNKLSRKEPFLDEISYIIRHYLEQGRRIFNAVKRKPRNAHSKIMKSLIKAYQLREKLPGRTYQNHYATAERLLVAFPHLTARNLVCEIKFLPHVPDATLTARGLNLVSPACQTMSCFSLLPHHADDTTEEYYDVIKAILLYQFEHLEIEQKENSIYKGFNKTAKMRRLLGLGKAMFEANSVGVDLKWTFYHLFLVEDVENDKMFYYGKVAQHFNKNFPKAAKLLKDIFVLKSGVGRNVRPLSFLPKQYLDQ